jgi:chemotaxis protein MotB
MAGGGGAWKVAYADFITAMMALFMVLWILGGEDELLEQLQEYFRKPPSPFTQESDKYVAETGDFSGHTGAEAKEAFFEKLDPAILKGIVNEFYKMLDMEVSQDQVPVVDIAITSDGLRVALYDRQDTPLFRSNHTELTDWADFLAQNLAWLIARYPFELIIESYTSELPSMSDGQWVEGDSAWELSTRRGNIFRRRLQFYANDQLNFRSFVSYGSNTSSFSEEELKRGKTEQRITLSLSLTEPHKLPNVSLVGDDLLVPRPGDRRDPARESDR